MLFLIVLNLNQARITPDISRYYNQSQQNLYTKLVELNTQINGLININQTLLNELLDDATNITPSELLEDTTNLTPNITLTFPSPKGTIIRVFHV